MVQGHSGSGSEECKVLECDCIIRDGGIGCQPPPAWQEHEPADSHIATRVKGRRVLGQDGKGYGPEGVEEGLVLGALESVASKWPQPGAGYIEVIPSQAPSQKGSGGAVLSPVEVELHRVAVRCCLALAALPAKSLPRGQRPMIKILQRLTPEPTGNQAIDQGRRLLLDDMIKTSLWGTVTSELSRLFGVYDQAPEA